MENSSLNETSLLNIADDLLKEGKKLRIEAKGYSMYPTIKPGYTVYIEACSHPDTIAFGDIIALKQDKRIILHRVVRKYNEGDNTFFITRGDGSMNPDAPVSFQMILGKATDVDSEGGHPMPVSKPSIPEWKYRLNKQRVWFILKAKKMIKMLKNG